MSVTTSQAVTLLENVLFESPTLAAANAPSWVAQSAANSSEATVAGLATAISNSPEAGIVQQVVRYYLGALGRQPSGSEIQFYVNYVEKGLTAAQIAQGTSSIPGAAWGQIAAGFADSPEFAQDYGLSTPGSVDGSNVATVITAFYSNILNRTPDGSEIAFYANAINNGTSVATLLQYFSQSTEYQGQIDGNIAAAIAAYGDAVVGGTVPPTIPLAPTGTPLGSSPLVITGTANTTAINVVGSPAMAAQSAVTAVTGVIGVTAVTAATGVQGVTAVTAVTPVAGQAAVTAVTDGAVTITDAAFTATGAGSITKISLADSGANSAINDNALSSLTLTGTTGALAITNINSAALTAHSATLTLTLNGVTAAGNTITDTNNEIATLDVVTATADSTLSGFADGHLTTLNLSGTNQLTLSTINASLTTLAISGGAGFSDGATSHAGGLAALGSHLTITDSSSGIFKAALDDTTQSFTGSSGADIITVSSLADATKTITAGSSTANEIIFEGGGYALTSASTGKFVGFQTVGVAGNVNGTIDLSVIDPTATGIELLGANATVSFAKVATGASLLIDPSTGTTATLAFADSTGATDSITVTMSSAVSALTLQDSAGVGIGTVSFVNNLAAAETNVTLAHVISSLNDNGLATLNVSGTAGLTIASLNEVSTPSASFSLNNTSSDGYGVTIGSLNDSALTSLTFAGSGVSAIDTIAIGGASLAIADSSTGAASISTITDTFLTSLTLAAGVSLGQAATALTTNGLQDGSSAGVTVAGGADNAHVTVNLTAGAASGKTDSITLGNGNNVVVDDSAVGTVTVVLGSGANLVELGAASLDTTAKYSVTFAARTATPPNAIFVGAAGTAFATAPNLVITGASTGDIIAFGNDPLSSNAALTATSLSSATTVAGAIAALEAVTTTSHKVAYGVFGGNTYIVESTTGTIGATDTAVVEVIGTQTLTASTGYVTLGSTASTLTGGGLSGAGFTIPAGTATSITLGAGANIVTLVGPSTGVNDTFTSSTSSTGLTINYQATSGTDTIFMNGSAGANKSDVGSLTVNDTSTGSAGLIIGSFTDNAVTSVTYNNSAATGATVTQQALTSANLTSINFTGGVAGQATNSYFFSGTTTTAGTLTVNDSNIGTGATIIGLTLTGGPSILTANMTGPGTLATGALSDNNLKTLNLVGSGTGSINIGALSDSLAGTFTVNDTSTSTGAAVIALAGLSAATGLTVTDSATASLTDSSSYNDTALATLTLTNTGAGTLTIGNGGITTNALSTVTLSGSGTGGIVLGTIIDGGSAALTVNDVSASTGAMTLPLNSVSAATGVSVADSSAGALGLGTISDNSLTTLSLANSGSAALTVGTVQANALATLTINAGATGTVAVGNITDNLAGAGVTVNDSSANTGAQAVNFLLLPSATGFTVNDSAKGALTIGAFTDDLATNLSFSNSGSALLTVTGITDNVAAATLTIPAGSSGAMSIDLIDTGATSLDIKDSGTGAATVAVNVATISLDNSAAGVNNLILTDAAAAPVALTVTGSGNQSVNLTDSGGTIDISGGTGIYTITLPAATNIITLAAAAVGNINSTPVTADVFKNFHLSTGVANSGDTLTLGFSAANIVTTTDANSGGNSLWTATNGMLVKPGMPTLSASVLNFIADIQSITQAGSGNGGGLTTSGIAGFWDGTNTWIAYNDHAGDVAVIELAGVHALGIEAAAGTSVGFVHIA